MLEHLVGRHDEVNVKPSDDVAARTNIIAISMDAGTWLFAVIMMVFIWRQCNAMCSSYTSDCWGNVRGGAFCVGFGKRVVMM